MITNAVRKIFKPWTVIDGKELVSYPWPEGGRIYINARTVPGDPTSVRRFEIVNGKIQSKENA